MAARIWRYGAMVLAVMAMLTATAAAAPGVWDEAAVPVARAEGVYCSLDGTTLKRFTGLSGATFADVWVRYRLDAGAGRSLAITAEGRAAGLDGGEVREVRARYLFQLADGRSDQGPLRLTLEKQYFDVAGGVVYRQEFAAPGYFTIWSRPDALEERVLLRLLTRPAFYADATVDEALARSAPLVEAGEGLLGVPWGTRPGAFADAVHVADIGDELAVYHAGMDVWPLLGRTRAAGGVWLIFSRRDGLVMGRIDVDGRQADAVERHLFTAAGQPLMTDKPAGGGPGELQVQWRWHTGRTTEVAFLAGMGGATVAVNRRGFSLPETDAAFAARLTELIKENGGPLINERPATWVPAAADGFAGVPWGAFPAMVEGALPIGGVNLGWAAVLFTDAGGRGWGEGVRLVGPGLMVFDGRQGFAGVSLRFAGADYRRVYDALGEMLGAPRTERAATVTWWAGANTVYVLDLVEGGKMGVVTVADKEFWQSRSLLFEYL